METLGALVRQARMRRGLRAVDVASATSRTQSFISRIENDLYKETPPPDVLADLERVLGIPQAEMLTALGYACGPPSGEAAPLFAADDPRAKVVKWLRDFDDRDAHAMLLMAEGLHTAANAERGDLTYKRKRVVNASS